MITNPVTSGLQLQFDARTLSLNDGDAVASWSDSSGQSNTASGAVGNRPTYKTGIIGANPVVRFGGGTQGMSGTFSSWASGTTGYTACFLATNFVLASTADYGGIVCLCAGTEHDYAGSNSCAFCLSNGANKKWLAPNITNTFPWNASTGVCLMPTSPSVVSFGISAAKAHMGINAASPYANTSVSGVTIGNPTKFCIGQRLITGAITTTNGCAFDLAMLCVYRGLLSDENINLVNAWMLREYGLLAERTRSY